MGPVLLLKRERAVRLPAPRPGGGSRGVKSPRFSGQNWHQEGRANGVRVQLRRHGGFGTSLPERNALVRGHSEAERKHAPAGVYRVSRRGVSEGFREFEQGKGGLLQQGSPQFPRSPRNDDDAERPLLLDTGPDTGQEGDGREEVANFLVSRAAGAW